MISNNKNKRLATPIRCNVWCSREMEIILTDAGIWFVCEISLVGLAFFFGDFLAFNFWSCWLAMMKRMCAALSMFFRCEHWEKKRLRVRSFRMLLISLVKMLFSILCFSFRWRQHLPSLWFLWLVNLLSRYPNEGRHGSNVTKDMRKEHKTLCQIDHDHVKFNRQSKQRKDFIRRKGETVHARNGSNKLYAIAPIQRTVNATFSFLFFIFRALFNAHAK